MKPVATASNLEPSLHRSASRRPESSWSTSTSVRRDAEHGRRDARAPHRTIRFMAPIHVQSLEVFPLSEILMVGTRGSRDSIGAGERGADEPAARPAIALFGAQSPKSRAVSELTLRAMSGTFL